MVRENTYFYFFWKPVGLATSRGKQESFVGQLERGASVVQGYKPDESFGAYHTFFSKVMKQCGLKQLPDDQGDEVVASLRKTFTRDQEYGLVNRLDTATSGLLYFAKTRAVYDAYPQRQESSCIKKRYLALVEGNPGYLLMYGKSAYGVLIQKKTLAISYPLMHHRHLDDRMIVVKEKFMVPESTKGRGAMLACETQASVVERYQERNQSLMDITITCGQRHQIRAHFGALGYPVVGDTLYGRSAVSSLPLHLWSVGCVCPEDLLS